MAEDGGGAEVLGHGLFKTRQLRLWRFNCEQHFASRYLKLSHHDHKIV